MKTLIRTASQPYLTITYSIVIQTIFHEYQNKNDKFNPALLARAISISAVSDKLFLYLRFFNHFLCFGCNACLALIVCCLGILRFLMFNFSAKKYFPTRSCL